jgi:glucose/arabinose dehydrogenase
MKMGTIMKRSIITLCLGLGLFSGGFVGIKTASAKSLPLHKLNLPDGFSIEVFAEVDNARQMVRSEAGVIYVGSRRAGNLYAVIDSNGDYQADKVITIDTDLNLPSGLAMRNGDLYVGAVDRILKYASIDEHLDNPPEPEVVIDTLPDKRHHGWKYLDFGPDGYLYIPVGAPCNLCLSDNKTFASIQRIDLSAENPALESFASGVRNSVGFAWHPVTHELWFTDNGRDLMGDELPPGELNRAASAGGHYGYPFFHANDIRDPEFGDGKTADDYVRPALTLDPHVAPLGMMFYTGNQFPSEFKQQILIAEHGSWNRTEEAGHVGYRITLVRQNQAGKLSYETLIDGWLQDNKAWGRPVDLLQLPDGSVLIADDHGDVIYRLSYSAT